MNWLLLSTVVCGISLQNIMQKEYNSRICRGAYIFSAASALFAALFFIVISGGRLSLHLDVAVYSVLFAAAYAFSTFGLFMAIGAGPLSLTTLVNSYSLVIPTFYGIAFLGEKADAVLIFAIALLLISLLLINREKKGEEKRFSAKWVIYVLLAFLGNGMCTVIQKMQQQAFSSAYKSEFMICALLLVFLVLVCFAAVFERKSLKPAVRGIHFCAVCGAANGLVNFLVMVLTNRMDVSVMFPLISAGGVILTYLISRFLYREKLSLSQSIGVMLGIGAVILLNL